MTAQLNHVIVKKMEVDKTTREQYFEAIKIKPTRKHWCKICDDMADFLIINTNDTNRRSNVLPLCNECAKLLSQKIIRGIKLGESKNENENQNQK